MPPATGLLLARPVWRGNTTGGHLMSCGKFQMGLFGGPRAKQKLCFSRAEGTFIE